MAAHLRLGGLTVALGLNLPDGILDELVRQLLETLRLQLAPVRALVHALEEALGRLGGPAPHRQLRLTLLSAQFGQVDPAQPHVFVVRDRQ